MKLDNENVILFSIRSILIFKEFFKHWKIDKIEYMIGSRRVISKANRWNQISIRHTYFMYTLEYLISVHMYGRVF